MAESSSFHEVLHSKMDQYAHAAYRLTRGFPKEELYASSSQLRRAALSVILNYVEGFARGREKVRLSFLETSYGSLKEAQYLITFARDEGFISDKDAEEVHKTGDEIGAMLWSTIAALRTQITQHGV